MLWPSAVTCLVSKPFERQQFVRSCQAAVPGSRPVTNVHCGGTAFNWPPYGRSMGGHGHQAQVQDIWLLALVRMRGTRRENLQASRPLPSSAARSYESLRDATSDAMQLHVGSTGPYILFFSLTTSSSASISHALSQHAMQVIEAQQLAHRPIDVPVITTRKLPWRPHSSPKNTPSSFCMFYTLRMCATLAVQAGAVCAWQSWSIALGAGCAACAALPSAAWLLRRFFPSHTLLRDYTLTKSPRPGGTQCLGKSGVATRITEPALG